MMRQKNRFLKMISILLAAVLIVTPAFPAFAGNPGGKAEQTAGNSKDPNAYAIYPIPQSVTYKNGEFTLGKEVAVVAEKGVDQYTKDYLKRTLGQYGINIIDSNTPVNGKKNIILGVQGSNGEASAYISNKKIGVAADLFTKNDAYMLDADNGTIVIQGKDADSVYYGVATLKMMLSSFAGQKILNAHIEDYASVKTRGYIEGFYGAWSFQERAELMKFAGDYKMNSYVYAAKGDSYHTDYSKLYPQSTIDEFKKLVEVGKQTKVEFGWSIHLGSFFRGLDINNQQDYNNRYNKLIEKLDQLAKAGVTKIDVLNDDFGSGSHDMVVTVLNRLNGDVKKMTGQPITYCPQGYNKAWSTPAELTALQKLDPDINIYWTGDDVNWPMTQETINFMKEKTNHAPDFWMNYPVNEHAKSGIFLGDITYYARDNVSGVAGFHSNPSRFAYANEVALYQLGALVWNNTNYSANAQKIWESAFDYLQPEVQDAYLTIARNVSNAPNSGRVPGFNESEYLKDNIAAVENLLDSGSPLKNNPDVKIVTDEFNKMITSVAEFRKQCKNVALVQELDPWLKSLDDIAHAGVAALSSMIALEDGNPSEAWNQLSSAIGKYDTRYSYEILDTKQFAKAGSRRLDPLVFKVINTAKNALTPVLNPYDDSFTPVIFAKMGGNVVAADANSAKMFDGDVTTAANWRIVQQKDDYYGLDLGRPVKVTDVTIIQGNNDTDHDVFHNAELQYSTDNKTWTPITAQVNGNTITAKGLDVQARYIRYYLKEAGTASKPDYWTNVREFTVNEKHPENDRIYTNVESLKETPLTLSGSTVSVKNLGNITLKADEYVGIKLVQPQMITGFVNELADQTGLALEYSYNGNKWTQAGTLTDPVSVKYLRLKNVSGADKTFDLNNIGMNVRNLQAEPVVSSSTMQLQSGTYESIFDGNLSTGILTNGNQQAQQNMIFDLGKNVEIHDITTVTTDGGDRFYNAKVQISEDNANWTDVVNIENDNSVMEVPYRYARGDANGQNARYLRVLITGDAAHKLQLNEIQINENYNAGSAASQITSDMPGNVAAIADNDLTTLFTGTAKNGSYVEYPVKEEGVVKQISIIQGTSPSGKAAAVKTDGTRVELGALTQSVSVFDKLNYDDLAAIRLEWDGAADVSLYEIYVAAEKTATDDLGVYVDPIIDQGNTKPVEKNIALGQPVVESGHSDGNKDYVVDGKEDTKWDSNFLKGAGASENAWIYVDLGEKPYDISRVVVKYFNKIYPTDYELQTSEDAVNWTSVKAITHPDNDSSKFNLVETMEFPEKISGRYVRLFFNSVNSGAAGNGVGVKEFEIYGTEKQAVDKSALSTLISEAETKAASSEYTEQTKNELTTAIGEAQKVYDDASVDEAGVTAAIAQLQAAIDCLKVKITEQGNIGQNQNITVSGTSNGVKESINDGDPATKWDSDYIKGTERKDEAWFRIDLGEQLNLIDKLDVSYFNKVYPTEYEVQISNDDTNWTTVKTLQRENNGPVHPFDKVGFATPVSARYIRMRFTELNNVAAGNGVGINEAMILGRNVFENAEVVEVINPADITVKAGETFDPLTLPAVIDVKTAVNGVTENIVMTVPVTWDVSSLKTEAGTYTLPGTLSLCGASKAENANAAIKVTIEGTAPAPEIDYTVLRAQIKVAETKEQSKYTEETYKVLKEALNAAKALDNQATDQKSVDDAAKALEDAINGLKEVEAKPQISYENLNKQIKAAENIAKESDKYTGTSYEAFKNVYETAKALSGKADSQEAVDKAEKDLKEAMAQLVLRGDKTALEKLIKDGELKREEDYTPETFETLQKALKAANDVKNNLDATEAEVEKAVTDLQNAINDLKEAEVKPMISYKELNDQIKLAEDTAKESNKYTSDSYAAFSKAYEAAKALSGKADTQEAADQAAEELKAAIAQLVLRGDKTELEKLIKDGESRQEADYTPETFEALQKALAEANKVKKNADATETEVSAAAADLQKAISGLKKPAVITGTPTPTATPTEEPKPTAEPTEEPKPTTKPTEEPKPTAVPTDVPTTEPTAAPTQIPTTTPDIRPTQKPVVPRPEYKPHPTTAPGANVPSGNYVPSVPQGVVTGDETNITLYVVLIVAALIIGGTIVSKIYIDRKRK